MLSFPCVPYYTVHTRCLKTDRPPPPRSQILATRERERAVTMTKVMTILGHVLQNLPRRVRSPRPSSALSAGTHQQSVTKSTETDPMTLIKLLDAVKRNAKTIVRSVHLQQETLGDTGCW